MERAEEIDQIVKTIIGFARSNERSKDEAPVRFIWTDEEMIDIANRKIVQIIERA